MKNESQGLVLYRKYRPAKFSDVVGQEQVVKVLEGSAKLGNISHSYLFAGSRGTGKTSVARIFAAAIGCSPNDIYEIDAASNRGIDDVRAIRDGVFSLPFESPFKVYIIDEAHMLTKEAWNAFLKTLEEPPKHVIFILATTEMEKVPETVISRCQIFQFKKPTTVMLKELTMEVAKKEGFSLDSAGAELIALLGEGSFRDTLGILQKVVSFSKDKKISVDEIGIVTGAPKGVLLNDFLKALSEKNTAAAISALKEAGKSNVDMKVFLKLALQKLRYVLLLRFVKEMENQIAADVSDADLKFLKTLAAMPESGISSATLSELLLAHDQISRAFIPELPIELALLRIFDGKRN
jgi:DNA polymerase-3 subunit gamma/tau